MSVVCWRWRIISCSYVLLYENNGMEIIKRKRHSQKLYFLFSIKWVRIYDSYFVRVCGNWSIWPVSCKCYFCILIIFIRVYCLHISQEKETNLKKILTYKFNHTHLAYSARCALNRKKWTPIFFPSPFRVFYMQKVKFNDVLKIT